TIGQSTRAGDLIPATQQVISAATDGVESDPHKGTIGQPTTVGDLIAATQPGNSAATDGVESDPHKDLPFMEGNKAKYFADLIAQGKSHEEAYELANQSFHNME
ncbi:MAG: hypothetical protein MHPSP_002445, partial [Paramarteilia canceri]